MVRSRQDKYTEPAHLKFVFTAYHVGRGSAGKFKSAGGVISIIRLFAFRGVLGLLGAWNLCAMTFGGGVDREFLGLVRCRTKRS